MSRQIAEWDRELRAHWVRRRSEIARASLSRIERAKRIEAHERERLRELAQHRRRVERFKAAHQKREREAESDEEVIRNLEAHHPELVSLFRRRAKSFRKTPHMSRTEAVLHWAHNHTDEVMAERVDEIEAELRHEIAEHQAAERELREARRPPRKNRPRKALAEAVPF